MDSYGWPVYHSVDLLGWCDQPMLLDFVLFNPLDDEKTHVGIAACAADLSTAVSASNSSTTTGLCLPDTNFNNTEQVTAQLQLVSSSATQSGTADNVVEALGQLQAFASQQSAGCNGTIQFALSGEVVVGIYVGSGLSGQGVLSTVLEQLVDYVQDEGFSDSLLVQLCDASGRSARYALGVVAVTGSNLASAQTAVQTWKNSSCVSTTSDQVAQVWQNITFAVPSSLSASSSNSSNSTSGAAGSSKLRRRDDECTTV
jgi:chitinase